MDRLRKWPRVTELDPRGAVKATLGWVQLATLLVETRPPGTRHRDVPAGQGWRKPESREPAAPRSVAGLSKDLSARRREGHEQAPRDAQSRAHTDGRVA